MKYKDLVYGSFEIKDKVILDLINSKTLLRLKEIDQAGYPKPFFPYKSYSRFDHSVGVYLLLRMFNTSIEEQIAGLIHDVSHSAFSHCIDYALDSGSEKKHTYQDDIFDEFVRKSEIPVILKKYNLNLEYILNDKNFTLKEKELPDLCADRIDYSLRTACVSKKIKNSKYFLNNLLAENGEWIFKKLDSAQKFAQLFFDINLNYYAGLCSALMLRTVGDCLRYSLSKNYISKEDLYTTDKIVINKIKSHIESDLKLSLLFDRMNNKVGFKNDPNDYDVKFFVKSRVVDPLCLYNGKIERLSEVNVSWEKIVKQERIPKVYFFKFDK